MGLGYRLDLWIKEFKLWRFRVQEFRVTCESRTNAAIWSS